MKSVAVWTYIAYVYCILEPVCTGIIYTSRACYGSNPSCTQHDINCNAGQKIAIVDAYYTDNTECGTGVSRSMGTYNASATCMDSSWIGVFNCSTVHLGSITEHGYNKFKTNEVISLYKKCSGKDRCWYNAPRRNDAYTFSVVKYRCIERPTGHNTAAIAVGVVATVVAVLVLTLVSVWIIRQRRAKNEPKKTPPVDPKLDMTYSLARDIPQNNYHEIQDLRSLNSDYDCATADGKGHPPTANTNNYFTIEPAGQVTATAEGDYDHIGNKPIQQTGDYDTTASVVQPGSSGYGYNHFRKKVNPKTHQNDYDTAASATQAVDNINMPERNTDEDDYDHFHRETNAPETVSSPYDTTSGVQDNSDYSVAGQMK